LGEAEGGATAGATLWTVTVVESVMLVLTPSLACNVTVTSASSLHTMVGVSVAVLVNEHVVPGSADVIVRVHEMLSGSPSGSVAVP
jgi:hypothetical protein